MSASHLQPIEKMMKNLKVDPSAQLTNTNQAPSKDGGASPSDATSCISSTGEATGSVKESDIDHESLITDQGVSYPTTSYYGYYYPGYDGTYGDFDNQGYYFGTDGMEIQYPVMQAENGSLVYFMPGFQPGYDPYSPYLPVTPIGVDGQYYGQQSHPTSPVFTSPFASPGYYPSPLSYGSEYMQSHYLWDPSFPVTESGYGNAYGGNPEISVSKPNLPAPNHTRVSPSKTFPRSEFGNSEIKNPSPSPDSHVKTVDKLGSNLRPDQILTKGYFTSSRFPAYQHASGGLLYPTTPIIKSNGRGWGGTEKLKTKAKVNNVGEFSLPNDHRARTTVNAKVTDENENNISIATVIKRDQYNLPDFTTKHEDALFFVIKSYSEDDIHKSIKYNVWASTPNGNKKLDSAYQEALERTAAKGGKCPIFLFFSVNASGQFCGVAEMIGPVDFNKNMDFWQQDKWTGFFPVKWHIIKDIPNPQLRHIILENNDNKPVTNSRDTQEVRFPQGIEMLGIFKNYVSKTSILDDFDFYESRQKVMQDKRIRPSAIHFDHVQKAEEVTTGLQSIDLNATKDIGKQEVVEKTKE